uniref:Uncharacterized protein n=1 Tax=Guillardia theta TaxID=55529 RepID=A0A7S4UIT5_GUITH|mmetsp:Transcript_42593/g.134095  ORF Transcript_42593/g.134095 Transcript_42593/m.134095 type:complete len:139 (+) Transcript_42593:28-444(+)
MGSYLVLTCSTQSKAPPPLCVCIENFSTPSIMQPSNHFQDPFDALALPSGLDEDLAQLPSELLPQLPPSRRSKDFDAPVSPTNTLPAPYSSSSRQELRDHQLSPTMQKQLRALEHCIKLLTSKERPRIKNTAGVWVTM